MTKAINPMLERVARAIHPRTFEPGWHSIGTLGDARREHAIRDACAAVQALLEPDEAMVSASLFFHPYGASDPEGSRFEMAEAFRAMLQTILEEPARQPVPGIYSEHQHARNMGEI